MARQTDKQKAQRQTFANGGRFIRPKSCKKCDERFTGEGKICQACRVRDAALAEANRRITDARRAIEEKRELARIEKELNGY